MADALTTNPTGIPQAPFVKRVEDFIEKGEVEPVLRKFNEMLVMYKRTDWSIQQRKRNLEIKIPELTKALRAVELLHEHHTKNKEATASGETEAALNVRFEVNDTLYVNGRVLDADTVCLWLGANVMVEYTLAEALDLLKSKLAQADRSLTIVNTDIDFLREQITTMEVNIARVFNWDVKMKQLNRK